MAYGNNGDKPSIYENYGTVFGDGKAYSIGKGNNKFRISIASQLKNNGNPQWDFKNQTGVSLDTDDLYRIMLASKQLIAIHNAIRTNPNAASGNPYYNVRQIRLPLVAKSNGKPYGEFIVGMRASEQDQTSFVFYMQYKYQLKDGSEISDYFYFRKAIGAEGVMSYCDANGMEIKQSHTEHLQFANFVQTLENAVQIGNMLQGIHAALKWGGSGYNRNNGNNVNYNSSPSGAPGDNMGGNMNGDFDDSIPF